MQCHPGSCNLQSGATQLSVQSVHLSGGQHCPVCLQQQHLPGLLSPLICLWLELCQRRQPGQDCDNSNAEAAPAASEDCHDVDLMVLPSGCSGKTQFEYGKCSMQSYQPPWPKTLCLQDAIHELTGLEVMPSLYRLDRADQTGTFAPLDVLLPPPPSPPAVMSPPPSPPPPPPPPPRKPCCSKIRATLS